MSCQLLAKRFKIIPHLLTSKQLHQCFIAVHILYDGHDFGSSKMSAFHVDENRFVDVIMLCALTAFGSSTETIAECRPTLDDYSEAARKMWTKTLLVCCLLDTPSIRWVVDSSSCVSSTGDTCRTTKRAVCSTALERTRMLPQPQTYLLCRCRPTRYGNSTTCSFGYVLPTAEAHG